MSFIFCPFLGEKKKSKNCIVNVIFLVAFLNSLQNFYKYFTGCNSPQQSYLGALHYKVNQIGVIP